MTTPAQLLAAEILATAHAACAAQPELVPVAVWDFDGTLLQGDCSEGFSEGGRAVYAGLVEVAIRSGLSRRYERFQIDRCREEYRTVAARDGSAAAHGFLAQAFSGALETELLALSRDYFEQTLQPWLFADAVRLLRALTDGGIRCWVLSASADFFVKGAAAFLPLPEECIHGIRLGSQCDGTLSGEIVAPCTSGVGKVERMRELLEEMTAREPGRRFQPVAAFGDNLETDGPLLEAVARTPLPEGCPVSVVVNGLPAGHRFRAISFHTTVGAIALPT